MFTLLITNNKGGTGKTAIAVNLYYFFNKNKVDTMLVDCDFGQWNAYSWISDNKTQHNVVKLKREEIKNFKIPGNKIVIIDTPPNFEAWINEQPIIMGQWATHLLIPIDGGKAVSPGASYAIEAWKRYHKTTERTAIILNRQKHLSRLPILLRKEIYDICPGIPILGVALVESQVSWEIAMREHKPVWKYGPKYFSAFEVIVLELESLWRL